VGEDVHTVFWWGDLREDHLENPDGDGSITLKFICKKWDRRVWTGLSCLRTGTDGGLL